MENVYDDMWSTNIIEDRSRATVIVLDDESSTNINCEIFENYQNLNIDILVFNIGEEFSFNYCAVDNIYYYNLIELSDTIPLFIDLFDKKFCNEIRVMFFF